MQFWKIFDQGRIEQRQRHGKIMGRLKDWNIAAVLTVGQLKSSALLYMQRPAVSQSRVEESGDAITILVYLRS